MTFATVSINRERLTMINQSLLKGFPGCTIHQSCDLMRAMRHLTSPKVDAMFVDADTSPDLIHLLNGNITNTAVYLLCRQDLPPLEMTGGIRGIITHPITKEKIQVALQTIPQKVREVV